MLDKANLGINHANKVEPSPINGVWYIRPEGATSPTIYIRL